MSVLPDFAMRRVRLVDPVAGAEGLSVDADGLRLGACALIAKRAGRFAPRGPAALDHVLTLAYGGANDAAAFMMRSGRSPASSMTAIWRVR